MKQSIVFYVLIMPLLAFGQDADTQSDVTIAAEETEIRHGPTIATRGLTYAVGSDTPFTGTIISTHPNGQKRAETQFVDGRANGTQVMWHPNGEKASESYWVEGRPSGDSRDWWENGNKKREFTRGDDGRRKIVEWYENGNKLAEEEFDKPRQEGFRRRWYDDGQLSSEQHYSGGKLHGAEAEWHSNGNKLAERNYATGRLIDEKIWSESGQLVVESLYNDYGQLISKTEYFSSGRKRRQYGGGHWPSTVIYKGGDTSWWESGQKKVEISPVDSAGKQTWTTWYENGQMKTQLSFTNGVQDDLPVVEWHPNGQKAKVGSQNLHGYEGTVAEWDERGNESQACYQRGKRINEGPCAATDSVPTLREPSEEVTSDQLVRRGKLFFEEGFDTPYSGAVKDYYSNGNKKISMTLVDGRPVGRQFTWYASGAMEGEAEWDENGTGYAKEWYEDGKLKNEFQYFNGKAHGRQTSWYPTGQKKSEDTHFVEGWPRDGTSTTWHENGQIKYQEIWAYGALKETKCWDEEGTELDESCRR